MYADGEERFAYLREVERFWVLLRRRGLMLSPKDVQQVEEWAEAGVPARVVCRALLEGADRFRAREGDERSFPSSLRYFAAVVEEHAARHAAASPGNQELTTAPEAPDLKSLLPPLVEAGRASTDERVRQAYRRAYRSIEALAAAPPPSLVERLVDIDQAIVDDVWSGLDEPERALVLDEVERGLVPERERLGEQGLRDRRRALFEDSVTRRWALLRLVPGPSGGPRVAGMGWWQVTDAEDLS